MVVHPHLWLAMFLKLQPYRQNSVKQRFSQKLSHRYYGPFRILRRIGSVAYELELPPSARIHPVFHVSLPKPCYGQPITQITPLPLLDFETLSVPQPVRIVGRHSLSDSDGASVKILV